MRGKPFPVSLSVQSARITPAGAGKTISKIKRRCKYEDHPRRCGENFAVRWRQPPALGSPPQVRGKLSKSTIASANRRITPAGAGKTTNSAARLSTLWDHPRRCGENLCKLISVNSAIGSPPQVRGKLTGNTKFATAQRITPAGAGKTPQ